MDKKEIKKWILKNCVNKDGNIDLSNLDFSTFDGNIFANNWNVKKILFQDEHNVKGSLYQNEQKVQGDLWQDENKVQGSLWQDEHNVKGSLYQNAQKVQGDLWQNAQKVQGTLWQDEQKVQGNLYQDENEVQDKENMTTQQKVKEIHTLAILYVVERLKLEKKYLKYHDDFLTIKINPWSKKLHTLTEQFDKYLTSIVIEKAKPQELIKNKKQK